MNKYTVSMLALLVIVGIVLFEGLSEYLGLVIAIAIPLLALLAWYNNVSKHRIEKATPLKDVVKEDEEDDGEYHNDFSKVPAGTADPLQPPPRSIGYGYGDGGQSVMDDLERIGIKTTDDKKKEE